MHAQLLTPISIGCVQQSSDAYLCLSVNQPQLMICHLQNHVLSPHLALCIHHLQLVHTVFYIANLLAAHNASKKVLRIEVSV